MEIAVDADADGSLVSIAEMSPTALLSWFPSRYGWPNRRAQPRDAALARLPGRTPQRSGHPRLATRSSFDSNSYPERPPEARRGGSRVCQSGACRVLRRKPRARCRPDVPRQRPGRGRGSAYSPGPCREMDRKIRLLVERREPPLIDPPIKTRVAALHGQGSQDATGDDPPQKPGASCSIRGP